MADPVVLLAAGVGLVWGFGSDRLAARWPAHEDGSVRPIDWRTAFVVALGGIAFGGTVAQFGADPAELAVMGVYVAALVVMFATDLDQRLLPDIITLPLIGLALVAYVTGAGPFVQNVEALAWAAAAAILIPLALFLLAIPFGSGAIGQGDLKLLVSVGLLAGAANLLYALVAGALLAGIVVGILLFVRRITMKSFVPYGPFLILGTLWAILALPRA